MNTAAATEDRPIVHSDTPKLDPDVLATVIDETARRIEARAARPSPVHLRSWEEIERFAEKAARSGMVPKDYIGKPDAIAIAVQMGSELGLAPVQSVQNIAVINGRPAIWGDALPGLCRASGMCKSIREWSEGEGDKQTFYCEAIRKDQPNPVVAKFSVADAKRAKLWQESPTVKRKSRDGGTYEADSGPWYSYPDRMLQMRARGFALRDAFPDVLKGLLSAEEARDIPWEDTGLSIVPPIATSAPIRDAREQMNRDAPLKAAASDMPRPPRVTEPPPKSAPATKRTDEQWNVWADKLEAALATLYRRSDLLAMTDRPAFQATIAEAPPQIRRDIDELLRLAYERLPAAPVENDPTIGGNDEVLITGEHNVMAGDD